MEKAEEPVMSTQEAADTATGMTLRNPALNVPAEQLGFHMVPASSINTFVTPVHTSGIPCSEEGLLSLQCGDETGVLPTNSYDSISKETRKKSMIPPERLAQLSPVVSMLPTTQSDFSYGDVPEYQVQQSKASRSSFDGECLSHRNMGNTFNLLLRDGALRSSFNNSYSQSFNSERRSSSQSSHQCQQTGVCSDGGISAAHIEPSGCLPQQDKPLKYHRVSAEASGKPLRHSQDGPYENSHLHWVGSCDEWEGDITVKPIQSAAIGTLARDNHTTARDNHTTALSDGARLRPVSAPRLGASKRVRDQENIERMRNMHPSSWNVDLVATYVTYIGMEQYRARFVHHGVNGPMLLQLSDNLLKHEIGIGPLGHRKFIIDEIHKLVSGEPVGSLQRRGKVQVQPSTVRFGQESPRRPASASHSIIGGDNSLGPSQGKMTTFERRAFLLYHLDRKAAVAAQQRALAEQLQHTAELTDNEVTELRGRLRDLESKSKITVQHAVGGLDAKARIPWQPVGNGTRIHNPNPERMGKPGDDPGIDLTFTPRISAQSRTIISQAFGEAQGKQTDFLARLENDKRKRDRAKLEMERKYYSIESLMCDPLYSKKKFQRDHEFLKPHIIAKLNKELSNNSEEYDLQLDELVNTFPDGEDSLERQKNQVLQAQGAKKVHLMAGLIRSLDFLARYHSDIRSKPMRLRELEKKFREQSLGPTRAVCSKDKVDMEQAVVYFGLLGWRGDGDEAITNELLAALIKRARAAKEAFEMWYDKVRDKPPTEREEFTLQIDWSQHPWATDGLGQLMEDEMRRVSESKGIGCIIVNKTQHAPAGHTTVDSAPMPPLDYLTYTVKLLSQCRWADLDKLDELSDQHKRLGVYRAVRTRKFIEYTDNDIRKRECKLVSAYESMAVPRKVIAKQQMDAFFERLVEDGMARRAKMDKLTQDKLVKEADILKSSGLYNTRHRPGSAR